MLALLVDERVGSELEGREELARLPLERAARDRAEDRVERPPAANDAVDELARPGRVRSLEPGEDAVELGLRSARPVAQALERAAREEEGAAHRRGPRPLAFQGPRGGAGRFARGRAGKSRFTTSVA